MLGPLGPLHGLYHHPQWMFPGFDPLGFSTAFQQHQAFMAQTSRQHPQGPEDSPQSTPEQDQPFDLSTKPTTPTGGTPPLALLSATTKPTQSVNKRKCAKPQWAKEGVELDRSRHLQQMEQVENHQTSLERESDNTPDTTTCEFPEKNCDTAEDRSPPPEDSENQEPMSDTENVVSSKNTDEEEKMIKLQRGMQSCRADWDEHDRRKNIDKLAKNLVSDSKESSEWEF